MVYGIHHLLVIAKNVESPLDRGAENGKTYDRQNKSVYFCDVTGYPKKFSQSRRVSSVVFHGRDTPFCVLASYSHLILSGKEENA